MVSPDWLSARLRTAALEAKAVVTLVELRPDCWMVRVAFEGFVVWGAKPHSSQAEARDALNAWAGADQLVLT